MNSEITTQHLVNTAGLNSAYAELLVAQRNYGVALEFLDCILPMMEFRHLPKMPEFLEGVINLRGKNIPVIDLTKCFGYLRKGYPIRSRILLAAIRDKPMGFIVDAVECIFNADAIDTQSYVFQGDASPFIQGMAKTRAGKMVPLISLEKVVSDREFKELAKANGGDDGVG